MAKFLSNRQRDLNVGIVSYTEGDVVLNVVGNSNISGIVTASYFYGDGSNLTNIVSNASVAISTTPPSTPNSGDLWYSSILGRTFVYYNDGSSSQWVDSAPFNVGIITALTGGIAFDSGSAVSPSWYFVGDQTTGVFSPTNGELTFVSIGSSVLNINPEGIEITGIVTSTSFVKSGGTSSEFLKADGSVDSSTYLTSYTETDTLDDVTGRGNTTSNGISVGVLTATSIVKSGGTSSEFLKADGSVDSSTYLTSIGISSAGTTISSNVTTLNFIGAGNTFAVNGNTVDISISGSGGGGGGESYWVSTSSGIHTLSNVGVGTTNPLVANGSIPKLHVENGSLYLNNPSSAGLVISPSTLGNQYFPTESGSQVTARYYLLFNTTDNASYPYLTNRTPSGDFAIFSGTTAGSGEIERLRFKGGDGTQNVYFSNCNIGVNTTNPSEKLHVLGNLLVAPGIDTTKHITQKAYETNNGTLSWEGSAGQLFSITNNLTSGSIFSVNDISGLPSIDVNANGTVAIVPYGANLGVGKTNPSTKLDVNGTITCVDINSTSDIKLKENVKNVEDAIEKISKVNGVSFTWKNNKKNSIGVIAQEIEEIFPELVNNGENKSVNYNGLIGVLIEGFKEQQNKINLLESEIHKLKEKLE